MSSLVSEVEIKNEDSIWLKIKKEKSGEHEDIFIGLLYISPSKNSKANEKYFFDLYEEILGLKQKGEVIVMGDLNARTGLEDDIIKIDKFDNVDIPNINQNNDIPSRNSEDKLTANQRGKELIELCKALKLAIVNGRKNGDLFGKCTSFQWNGNSVVDYVLSSHNLFHNIETFTIGNYIPWISDHCALHLKLNILSQNKPTTQRHISKHEIYNSFHWNRNSSENFNLGLDRCANDLEQIMNLPDDDTQNIGTLFTKVIYKITEMGKIEKKKTRNLLNPKWFDKECTEAKNDLKRMGKGIKDEPNNVNLRENISKSKRLFKNLVKKKRRYKEDILKNMHLNKGGGKCFWKSLEKLGNPKKMTL